MTLVFASVLSVSSAHAATFTVNSTGDQGDFTTLDGVGATTFMGSTCTLRAAIQQANSSGAADTIQFNITGGVPQRSHPGRPCPPSPAPSRSTAPRSLASPEPRSSS